VDKIDVLRKTVPFAMTTEQTSRHMMRRCLPKSIAIELYNPETDDTDTSEGSSSSPDSVSSVVSVMNEEGVQGQSSGPQPIHLEITKQPSTPGNDSKSQELCAGKYKKKKIFAYDKGSSKVISHS